VCEVEVDPETGVADLVRYTSVDDCGRAVNPMILHGQTHGGIAQGVGQALWESCAYDPGSGQLLSATLMDYALPATDQVPPVSTVIVEVPSEAGPFGAKGVGEPPVVGAPAAIANAVADAVKPLGVAVTALPILPERLVRRARRS
jgi:carbon-monoxide dehydrogenase large subunit